MKTDANCIFCKIVAGEIPCHRIAEDDHTLAFLDIGPISKGHALVIPKMHVQTLDALPLEVASVVGVMLVRVAKALKQVTGCDHYNILQNNGKNAGQVVPHVHFHLIPKHADMTGLNFDWPAGQLDSNTACALLNRLHEVM